MKLFILISLSIFLFSGCASKNANPPCSNLDNNRLYKYGHSQKSLCNQTIVDLIFKIAIK